VDVGEVLVKIQGDVSGLRAAVDSAITKLDELGKAAKTQERVVSDANKGMQTSTVAVGAAIGSFIGTIGVQAVGAAIRYAGSIKDLASTMTDLSKQTGIAVSTLYALKPVLENNGASVEQFSVAVFRLGVQIGQVKQTTDPVYQALKELGISFDAIRIADNAERVQILAKAFNDIEDPIKKDAFALQFFGLNARALSSILPEVADKMGETDAALEHATDVLNQSKQSWTNFQSDLARFATITLAALIQGFKDAAQGAAGLAAKIEQLQQHNKISPAEVLRQGQLGGPEALLEDIPPRGGGADRLTPPHFNVVDPAAASAIKSLTDSLEKQKIALQGEIMALNEGESASLKFKLTQDALAQLHAKTLSPAISKLIDDIVRYSDTLSQLKFKLEALKLIEDERADKQNEYQRKLNAYTDALETQRDAFDTSRLDDYDTALKKVNNEFAVLIAQARDLHREGDIPDIEAMRGFARVRARAGVTTPDTQLQDQINQATGALSGFNNEVAANEEMSRQLGVNFDSLSASISTQQQQLKGLIDLYILYKNNALPVSDLLDQITEASQRLNESFKEQQNNRVWNSLADSINSAITTSINGVIQGTQTLADAMRNMAKSIMLAFVNELTQQFILNPILDMLFGQRGAGGQRSFGSGLIGNLIGGIGSLFGGSFGWATSPGTSFTTGGQFAAAPFRMFGGPVPSYAMGGPVPIMAHVGEYVMSAPAVSRIGMSRLSAMNAGQDKHQQFGVVINGDIIPKDPSMTPAQIVQIVAKNIHDDELIAGAIKVRIMRNSGGNQ